MDRPDSVKCVEDLEIEDGAAAACARLTAVGYELVVITNQSAVGRGWMDRATLDVINDELNTRLGGAISRWFVCDHGPDDGCRCRKPDTLLLEQAHAALGFDPANTWFVADAGRDIEAARRFGCRPALLRTGKGRATEAEYPDVPTWDTLDAFAEWLTNRGVQPKVL